jgi:N-acetylglucosamine-6-phosphate deacetylase
MELVARRYDNAQPVRIHLEGGRIRSVTASQLSNGDGQHCPWIAPGLVDIQVNGYDGQEFSSQNLTAEQVARIVRRHYDFGVTGICPTLTTNGFTALAGGMKAIAAACEQDAGIGRRVLGIHLEGPYMSREDGPRGAHPLEHCRRPDWDEFRRLQDAAGGRIVILTMSVEFDEAPEFIARVTDSGVVVSIGHTAANTQQIRAAVDAGAKLSTHLGNGAHRTLRRHPNYLWDQMAEDRLMASIIADGHHLPPEVVKSMVRAKTPARTILVSDESGLAGLPPGRYPSSGCELEILPDGRLVIAGQDQLLAGASRPIGDGIVNVMRFAGVDLATAVEMATRNPLTLLNRPAGGLRPGDPADLVLFDLATDAAGCPEQFTVRATIADGELVFGQAVPIIAS